MPGAGLFELRKDAVTGWWVAVVVDRDYDRSRFARRASPVPSSAACANCLHPGEGVRVRTLRPRAFTVVGTQRDVADAPRDDGQAGLGLVGDAGSWRTIVAPRQHHGPLAAEAAEVVVRMLALARDAIAEAREANETAYVQVVQNWGHEAGAMTNHLCLDVYDLPQIPHRIGEELGGAARYVIREGVCPYCALVHDEVRGAERLVFEDRSSVCFAPFASRSPFELWIVPREHEADFGQASEAVLASTADTLRRVLGLLDALDAPPYNLVLHSAPLQERVDETYHWHWEIHPRLRAVGGLELGTGLPVNPISPEAAADELLRAGGRAMRPQVSWPEAGVPG